MSNLARYARRVSVTATTALAGLLTPFASSVAADPRPNILLIVADDMGYSDLGVLGGEIRTPTLNALASRGMLATNFYVAPTCSPTRSMLLTGVDNHMAGLGNMAEFIGPEQKGKPGYEGHLNNRVTSIGTLLRHAGYHTYMAGKWHLGEEPAQWPAAKGFERDFTLLQGGGSNWSDMTYPSPAHPHLTFTRNGKLVDKLDDDHFSSAAYSDFIIQSVDEHKSDSKPFFAYLSFQAVHAPLAAPDDWLGNYKGQYAGGYDAVRAARVDRMRKLGIVPPEVATWPRLPTIPPWNSLTPEQQKLSARKMEVYAAMLENMDHHTGRVLDHLQRIGKLDNTLVIFLSDNGAEGVEFAELVEKALSPDAKKWVEATFDFRPDQWGRKGSISDYGAAWAQVGSGPLAFFKAYTAEGGIRAPLIVAGPGVVQGGRINASVLHVTDIVPTLLEVAGVQLPRDQAAPITGKSFTPILSGRAESVRGDKDWLAWEMFGNRALRQGDWKVLSLLKGAGGTGEWQLFNLRSDPGETRDLANDNPAKAKEMATLWNEYARTNGVIFTRDGPFERRH